MMKPNITTNWKVALPWLLLIALVTTTLAVTRDKGDQCFCQLEGKIDDCLCNVDTVDYFNNMKIFPRLQSILHKPYFRYFQYNARKPCPFWNSSNDKCKSSNCEVKSCTPDEIPPGLKGSDPDLEKIIKEHNKSKYSKEGNQNVQEECDMNNNNLGDLDSKVDDSLSQSERENLKRWQDHDSKQESFCDVDTVQCPDCDYVDLSINPERYTGYSGEASHKIWRAIYEENCFNPPKKIHTKSKGKAKFSAAFLQDTLQDMCLEKRAFYRAVSGLHTSISIHLCANYLINSASDSPFMTPVDKYGPNVEEFERRFDPEITKGQGPYWLKNLYFVYLLELRALAKVAPYLEQQAFFTGKPEEDKETQIAVKEILNLMRSFPDHFDETVMFNKFTDSNLKEEFRSHFHNISRVMDCVSCDKCKLWGKLQVTGLGTALKILFTDGNNLKVNRKLSVEELSAKSEVLQTLTPPPVYEELGDDFKLTRNEIVALFNAFGRISTSIRQLENFRNLLK